MGKILGFGITFLLQINRKMGFGGESTGVFGTKYRSKVDLVPSYSFITSLLFRIKLKKCCQTKKIV